MFCKKCELLVEEEKKCAICGQIPKKGKNNYFVFINIRQQITKALDTHFEQIWNHINKKRIDGEICDSMDGALYKKITAKLENEIALPLSVNVDGAKIFASSKSSLWPIQIIQHYLPESIRYLRENILIVGLFCGPEKPDVSVIMEPFAKEMSNLKKGIFKWHENRLLKFLPILMFCVCDIPARAQMQNCKQSGYYGCMCCVQPGEPVKNPNTGKSFVRFLKVQEPAPWRTHKNTIKIGSEMLKGNEMNNTNGIKGLSCMIAFKHFDLVEGFGLFRQKDIRL